MTIRIVLQARMGSRRRPGKTLADIGGQPLLARCLERLAVVRRRGGPAWQLVVATSTAASDDAVAQLAQQLGYLCVRGSEEDVLARYLQATADLKDRDVVVRATADNPLYCPQRTFRLVTEHLAADEEYTGLDPLSPLVPEAFRVGALRTMAARTDLDDYCHEHVTPFFRRDDAPFRARRLPPDWNGIEPDVRLTVDTPEDVAAMDRIYRTLIALTGHDRPQGWTLEQIFGTAKGLLAADLEAAGSATRSSAA